MLTNKDNRKEPEDKTDKYLKEIIKDVKLETPSKDFTKNVMRKISLEGKTVSQTKLSFFKKYKFILIFSLTFISIFLIVFFFTDNQGSFITDTFNVNSSEFSFFDRIRDFFKLNIEFSAIHIIIIISILILFSLDSIIPKINKKYKN